MTPLAAFALSGCLAVAAGSDRITAGGLAAAVPAFASADRDAPVALAPAPGVQRVIRAAELRQIGARLAVKLPDALAQEVCFERPVTRLDPVRILDVLRRQLPGASITILDFSRMPAPDGELEFPLRGLRPTPGGEGFWSGAVRYGAGSRFMIWAKVKVLVTQPRVIAVANLKPAHPVAASDLRVEMREGFPAPDGVASIEEAAGRVLRRPVAAGTPLLSTWLDPTRDIARGDTILVEVWSGSAHLELQAEAEASGSIGETIPVRNPSSNRRFLARVEGKGRVSVGQNSASSPAEEPASEGKDNR